MPPTDEDVAWLQSTFRPIPRPTLPDDCIEYSIHIISADIDLGNDSEIRTRLRSVQKHANELQKQWLKDYIWQRQGFSLGLEKEDDVNLLRGRTEYGDSIEDEWVVVWLLRELTKKFNDVWVKVTDSDGEFLLIEASGTIPAWLEPDVADNRVWINNGQLKIVRPGKGEKPAKRTSEKLSLRDALQIILNEPKRIMHSTSIEEEAFYRLRNYPAQIQSNMHYAMVRLPRKLVFILQQKSTYISPAIEAFYLRDPVALKILQQEDGNNKLLFPPHDLVTVSIKFPKVGYAQIKAQDFPPPLAWKNEISSQSEEQDHAQTTTGMKVTSGFEMLLADSQHQDKPAVREIKLLLDDLESGDEQLPTDTELEELEKKEDDEKWLDISFDDLDHELGGGKSKPTEPGKKPEFGDKAAQENLRRIVKQFEQFLNDDNDEIGQDGMFGEDSDDDAEEDLDDSDDDDDGTGEDREASFDEDEFTKMMQEMMGMPPEVMKELMSGDIDALATDPSQQKGFPTGVYDRALSKSKIEEVDTSDEEDIMDMKQMEAELRASGALNLNASSARSLKGKGRGQLSQSVDDDDDDNDEDEHHDSDDNDDFDAEFARNILQSFKASGGTGGPAANLMSMFGNMEGPASGGNRAGSGGKEKAPSARR